MKFVLKRKWMSHLRGDIVNITEHLGGRLIKQGTARPYDEKRDSSVNNKQFNKAPRDKMFRGATNKQAV